MTAAKHHLSLNDLLAGDRGYIAGFSNDEIPIKFYDMGLIPGSEFTVYKKAPFNGPVCIQIGREESLLALRINEAKVVLVEKMK